MEQRENFLGLHNLVAPIGARKKLSALVGVSRVVQVRHLDEDTKVKKPVKVVMSV